MLQMQSFCLIVVTCIPDNPTAGSFWPELFGQSQVGEVEACELLQTLSIVLGRILHKVDATLEDEVISVRLWQPEQKLSGCSWERARLLIS